MFDFKILMTLTHVTNRKLSWYSWLAWGHGITWRLFSSPKEFPKKQMMIARPALQTRVTLLSSCTQRGDFMLCRGIKLPPSWARLSVSAHEVFSCAVFAAFFASRCQTETAGRCTLMKFMWWAWLRFHQGGRSQKWARDMKNAGRGIRCSSCLQNEATYKPEMAGCL